MQALFWRQMAWREQPPGLGSDPADWAGAEWIMDLRNVFGDDSRARSYVHPRDGPSSTSAVSRKSTSVTWLGFDRMGRSGSTLGLPLCLHDEKPSTKVRANPPNTFQTLPLCSHYDFLQGIPRLQLHNSILERRKLVIEAAGTVRMTRPPGWRFQPW